MTANYTPHPFARTDRSLLRMTWMDGLQQTWSW